MQYKSILLGLFLTFTLITVSSNDSYAAKKSKKKPGVVLKKAGYYCPIEMPDKVLIRPSAEIAVNSAKIKGYMAPEEYFKTNCETLASNPHILEPKEVLSFNFSFKFEGDITSTSTLKLNPGTYKLTLSCATEPGEIYAHMISANDSTSESFDGYIALSDGLINTKIVTISDSRSVRYEIRDKVSNFGTPIICQSGNILIERLS